MQCAPAALHAVDQRRIEPRQFRLELFVDEEQGFQRAADIAATTGDDLVDGDSLDR